MKSLMFAGALTLPASLFAATELEPVVVVASGHAQHPDEVLAAVTVLSRAEIELAQAQDVAELLRRLPGVDVVRSGGPGQLVSVFIRGAESNHSLVLIDGERLNPATAGGAALQNVDPDQIERIEVLRGPRSTLYGSDAIGGVINIITRGAHASGATASLRGGSHDTVDADLGVSLARGNTRLALNASHLDTEGEPTCDSSSLDRGYRRSGANLKASTVAGPLTLSARAWVAQGTVGYLDYCSPSPDYGNQPLTQDFRNQAGTVELSAAPRPGWSTALSLSHGLDDLQQNQAVDRVRTERPGLAWDNQITAGPGQLALNASWQRESVDALSSFSKPIDAQRDQLRLSGSYDGNLDAWHWLLGLARADDDGADTATTWNLELGRDLTSATRLLASAGTGYRAPDVTDLYGFGGNPELEPERSLSLELGLRQRIGASQQLELRLFQQDIDELISLEYSPDNDPAVDFGYRAVNIDQTRNQGLELSWQAQLRGWQARAAAVWQDPRNRSDDSRLLRRARQSANLGLNHAWGPATLGLELEAHGNRADLDAETGQPAVNGGYALLHLAGSLDLGSRWTLSARGENLLDRDYRTVAGYHSPGAGGYLTLRYRTF